MYNILLYVLVLKSLENILCFKHLKITAKIYTELYGNEYNIMSYNNIT